jgi:DNA repair exonuclease SbcCD ATPase subunit
LGVSVEAPATPDSVNAQSALDAAIKQLETLRRGIERRLSSARELLRDVLEHPAVALPDEEALRTAADQAQRELDEARKALVEAQNRSAQERADLVRAQEEREEIKALAEIALRHLGAECPVCRQPYDQLSTRRRLEDLARGPSPRTDVPETENSVAELAKIVEQREGAQRNAAETLRQGEKTAREWRAWISERERRLAEMQIILEPATDIVQQLQQAIEKLIDSSKLVAAHYREGEGLTLALARAGEEARRLELQRELESALSEAKQSAENLRLRTETGRLVDSIVEGLRGAASEVVSEQLRGIEPLLQRIYATMDPHPAFRVVRLLASFSYGRGHLKTAIDDVLANVSSESPENVLSSSQMNALAVAIFLALNLGVRSCPLNAAILDDPLQSLDDVNLLGMVDLLRRIKDRRQLLVSTHDPRFGHLLARKLRPVRADQRTRLIEIGDWNREGPVLVQGDVPKDLKPLRIAA